MNKNEQYNAVLTYLKHKNMGEWTSEDRIEKDFFETINHMDIRYMLPDMVKQNYLEFSKLNCSYKITAEGRRFSNNGGYR